MDQELTTEELDNGNAITYKIVNGTAYHKGMRLKDQDYKDEETPDEVVKILEEARRTRAILRIFFGDTSTGRDWLEENDVKGRIGRSTGRIKIPLLVAANAHGGPGLLDHCIVKIMQGASTLYQHPLYNIPVLTLRTITTQVTPTDAPAKPDEDTRLYAMGYRHEVQANGEAQARFKTLQQAERYIKKMQG